MKKLNVDLMHFKTLNDWVRDCEDSEIFLDNLIGQRYVAAGSQGKNIIITGTPAMRWAVIWMAPPFWSTAMHRMPPVTP